MANESKDKQSGENWCQKLRRWREERLAFQEKRKEAKFRWLEKKAGLPHQKAFFLVFWMLVSLTLLVIGIAGFPLLIQSLVRQSVTTAEGTKIIFDSEIFPQVLDYSKWVLSALLAAFGAWIGAGAAYFFSKESLQESSRATEEALRIQQQTLGTRGQEKLYVKDIPLTAINPSFVFPAEYELIKLIPKLDEKLGYWFVPIIETDTGILKDVIHSQAFWKYDSIQKEQKTDISNKTIKDILEFLDQDEKNKKLHGLDVFFVKIKLSDTLQDVADRMKSPNTAVAIVVDAKGKPTHCLTRTDLGTFLKPEG